MRLTRLISTVLSPTTVVSAHCDLPCGVYDPAQARIEAESVKAIAEKYQANEDPEFRTRAILIKEQRADGGWGCSPEGAATRGRRRMSSLWQTSPVGRGPMDPRE